MASDPAVAKPITVELVLGFPPRKLSPNARPSRYELARIKKAYREACKIDALKVRNTTAIDYPLASQVTARVVFVVPKGDLPDEDNCTASFKAGWDGIVDSKLISDDSPKHLHVEETLVIRGARREVRVTLVGAS
ncbi:MAG: hypothetical protein AB7U95_35045 [Reyranella sp.]